MNDPILTREEMRVADALWPIAGRVHAETLLEQAKRAAEAVLDQRHGYTSRIEALRRERDEARQALDLLTAAVQRVMPWLAGAADLDAARARPVEVRALDAALAAAAPEQEATRAKP